MRIRMKSVALAACLVVSSGAIAQQKLTRQQYINTYAPIAVSEMEKTGIPASITLAQGILESGDGNSELARKAKNHFGIKCHSEWKGNRFFQDDDEKDECFRVYKDAKQSFKDHSDFLVTRSRYDFLFELKPNDYKGWAKGLKQAGYATNPKYPALLIKIIEDNNLHQYDKGNKKPFAKKDNSKPIKQAEMQIQQVASTGAYRVELAPNDVKYVMSQGGESPTQVAARLNMRTWQITKYNDVARDYTFTSGSKIYLAPKRNRAAEKYHQVKAGDTIWSISQQYAIKPKKLAKKNRIEVGAGLKPGTKLRLR